MRDGFHPQCMSCRKRYYDQNRDKTKNYYMENPDEFLVFKKQIRDKIILYEKSRKESDLNFILASNLRSRTSSAFKSENVMKTNKTFDLFGSSHSFFKSWILHQIYGKLTLENHGPVWQFDHCLPIASFNLLHENDMKKCFKCVNIRPMYSSENNSKEAKIDVRLYLLPEKKANYFMKINASEG